MINCFQIPPFRTYLKSEYGLAFVARAFAVQKNHLLPLLLVNNFTSQAPSVWFGPFFACAILMQCSCRVSLSWSLIPSNLKVVIQQHTLIADASLRLIVTMLVSHFLHHWLLTSRSPAIFCLFSLFRIPNLLSYFLHDALFCWRQIAP